MDAVTVTTQLFQLEQLDTDLERRAQALTEIRRRQADDPALATAESRLDAARRRAAETAANQRRLEGDLTDVDGRITRDQTRLYSGQIVDPRELAALEREMDHLREQRSALEDQLLAMMDRDEVLDSEMATLSRGANDLRQRRETDLPELARQEEEMTDAIAGLRAERETLATSIDSRAVAQYQRLRRARGHGVARIAGGVCGVCRVVLPPKDIQHVRSGQMVTCGNCGVILHGA